MRILAAADAYVAMRADRPHRPALDRDMAAAELQRAAGAGRLCQTAVSAVLEAAGHDPPSKAPAPKRAQGSTR